MWWCVFDFPGRTSWHGFWWHCLTHVTSFISCFGTCFPRRWSLPTQCKRSSEGTAWPVKSWPFCFKVGAHDGHANPKSLITEKCVFEDLFFFSLPLICASFFFYLYLFHILSRFMALRICRSFWSRSFVES